jgi:signal transduction histidine kinase
MLKVYTSRIAMRKGGEMVGVMDSISFEVYDTGIGISKENLEHMFKLFGKVM